jgi:hypothetical protein
MNRFTPTPLQRLLLAQLPADGSCMTVQAIADAVHITGQEATDELFELFMADRVHFHVRSDSYSVR